MAENQIVMVMELDLAALGLRGGGGGGAADVVWPRRYAPPTRDTTKPSPHIKAVR
jgi:hypothetical protein